MTTLAWFIWLGAHTISACLKVVNEPAFGEPCYVLLSSNDRLTPDEEWHKRNGVRYDKDNLYAYIDDIVEGLLR